MLVPFWALSILTHLLLVSAASEPPTTCFQELQKYKIISYSHVKETIPSLCNNNPH